MKCFPPSPFGVDICADTVIERMQSAASWEDKYRQVILLGKQLPLMPEVLKSEQVQVAGCESQVWLISEQQDDHWFFCADSDARIVRGLIAVVLAAVQGKTGQAIQSFDMDGYFTQLDLVSHLSASRGNGLKAIVDSIYAMTK